VEPGSAEADAGKTVGGAPVVDPEYGTRRFHNGKWYTFCSMNCRAQFMASPDRFVKDAGPTYAEQAAPRAEGGGPSA
jgi:YHS domain-containing protein